MSERGSFCTEYIYCDKCLEVVQSILIDNDKFLSSETIPTHSHEPRIVAGKIGGLFPGEELLDMECEYGPAIAARICHPLRIAVLAEKGEKIFHITPEMKP